MVLKTESTHDNSNQKNYHMFFFLLFHMFFLYFTRKLFFFIIFSFFCIGRSAFLFRDFLMPEISREIIFLYNFILNDESMMRFVVSRWSVDRHHGIWSQIYEIRNFEPRYRSRKRDNFNRVYLCQTKMADSMGV